MTYIKHDTQAIKVAPTATKSATAIEYERLLANPKERRGLDAGDLWTLAMENTKR